MHINTKRFFFLPVSLKHFKQLGDNQSRLHAWTHRYIYANSLSFRDKSIYFLLILSIILIADLATKYWAEQSLVRAITETNPYAALAEDESLMKFPNDQTWYALKEVPVINHFWSFFYVRNYNVGFSILSFLNQYFEEKTISGFVLVLQGTAVCGILGYFLITRMELWLPFALIISGGFANIVDRTYRGYVVDFIKWYWESSPIPLLNPWPLFNLADASITLGMSLFIWSIFIK